MLIQICLKKSALFMLFFLKRSNGEKGAKEMKRKRERAGGGRKKRVGKRGIDLKREIRSCKYEESTEQSEGYRQADKI